MPESASLAATPTLPMRTFALAMVGATIGALLLTALVARLLNADSSTLLLAVATLAIASSATFIPVALSFRLTPGNFGLAVLGASMLRVLLLLGIALGFDQTRELARSPFFVSILSGAAIVLIVETVLAISILARIERLKAATQPTA